LKATSDKLSNIQPASLRSFGVHEVAKSVRDRLIFSFFNIVLDGSMFILYLPLSRMYVKK